MSDYEIDDIRRIRREVSEKYDHDLRKVVEYYRRVENELRESGRYRFVDQKARLTGGKPASQESN